MRLITAGTIIRTIISLVYLTILTTLEKSVNVYYRETVGDFIYNYTDAT